MTYLYCLVRSAKRPVVRNAPPGIPGAGPVRLLDAGRHLWVVAADVSDADYGEAAIAEGLGNLDWVSRRGDDDRTVVAFSGKFAGIMAASPGSLGAIRGLGQLRHVLTTMGVLVVPQQRGVGAAHMAFDDEGRLKDPAQQAAIEAIAARLVDLVRRQVD